MAAYDAEKKAELSVLMAMSLEAEAAGNREKATELLERAAAIELPKKAARSAVKKLKSNLNTIAKKAGRKADRVKKSSIKVTKPRKASSERAFAGRESSGMWACETCMGKGKIVTFRSKAAVEAHESSHRGGASYAALTVPAHPRMTKKCKWCSRRHSKGQCSSHGPGSFEATHPGQFPENDDDE